jgi:hypothetical protein
VLGERRKGAALDFILQPDLLRKLMQFCIALGFNYPLA